jgi:hypothetical protein
MNLLFLNHKIKNCGVYQYGYRLYNILKKSLDNTYIYLEIDSYEEYINNINKHQNYVIIYNYHGSTMSWLNHSNIFKYCLNIGISHESDRSLFDINLSIDPDEIENNNIFNIPRPIYENINQLCDINKIVNTEIKDFINYNEGTDVPIFGSFGFGFLNKGFDKIIKIINENYDKAIIKLIITKANFDSNSDYHINHLNQLFASLSKKNDIKLLITHTFFTNEDILLFLSNNTCNIFLYDKMEGRGISSVIDYAISVNKPFVISDSCMFRHIYDDKICVYKTNIKDAICNSKKILPDLIKKYSNSQLINKIDSIILMSNQILGCDISAFYYKINHYMNANVTKEVIKLYNKYLKTNTSIFYANNTTFTDTYFGECKKLFINISTTSFSFVLTYEENGIINWIDIINKIEEHKTKKTIHNIIDVSIGEIFDKYSILELKQKYITDKNKLKEIEKEINSLEKFTLNIKKSEFYRQLLYINEQIWLDTDKIKQIKYNTLNFENPSITNLYIELSNKIFENNQKRFRLKNYFNILENSNINECKSYSDNNCVILINDEKDIYLKIPEISYLCINYDYVYINNNFKYIINNLFKNPNIRYLNEIDSLPNIPKYQLLLYNIDENIKDVFEFNTIKYKSSGKLGDFLNQLSIISEKFYKTGRKGELYISDDEEKFVFGAENTFNDTYSVISSQKYIKKYSIYNNQNFDINLSTWRIYCINDISLNWHKLFSTYFDINWGSHKWLSSNLDSRWNNKIIINITPYRFIDNSAINKLQNLIKDELQNCIFISNEKDHYDYFCEKTKINIEYYKPNNFEEIIIIVNSCKLAYLGFSSMAVIANALHKNHYMMGLNNMDYQLNNLKTICPHVLDILV